MSVTTAVVLTLLAGLLLYVIVIYNGLVALKHAVSKAWANIDVLLKQRHDELPKLIETCRQYMQFEKDTLERVMAARVSGNAAREKGDVPGVAAANAALAAGLGRITATVEAYPELKSNQTLMQLMGRITGLENGIADRREFYNESVNANNVRLEQFPDVIVARFFAFKPADLLEFTEDEKRDVDTKALWRS